MRIRRVELNQKVLKTLDHLDRMIFPTDDPYTKLTNYWWLVEDEEGPLGFAGLEVKGPATVFLCRAGVFQRFAGQGIHRKLIRARETFARGLRYSTVTTYVMGDNLKSANNFIHMGYRLYKPSAPVVGALHFKKEL
jgi:GNAT superfamily N-acetyltransferase